MIKVALLTTDSREHFKDYANPDPYFGAAPEALIEGFKLLQDEVEVHVLCCLQKAPVSSPAKLGKNIYYHPLQVGNFGWLKSGYQGCIRLVRRKLRTIRPHVVHGQGTERDCAVCAVTSGFPNVLTIHGNIAELARLQNAGLGSFYWLQARLENLCLRNTMGVFCNSKYTHALVAPRTNRCWLVPNAIRPEFFASRTVVKRNPTPTILNVGVISPRKRQNELLELARRLHSDGLQAVWKFVGACDAKNRYASRFLALMKDGTNLGYAEYLGEQTCSQLIALMDQAHMLVHFPYEESFGLVAAEALARGLFVVASDVGGLRDILTIESNARLIAPHDFDALGDCLRQSLQIKGSFSIQSAKDAVERYAPMNIAREHLAIYRSVCSEEHAV